MKNSMRQLLGGYQAAFTFVWLYLVANELDSLMGLPQAPHRVFPYKWRKRVTMRETDL